MSQHIMFLGSTTALRGWVTIARHVNSELAIHLQHNVTVILSDRIPMVEKGGDTQQHGTASAHLWYEEREANIRLS